MGRQRERDNIRQLVSAYLDGELPPEDAAWVGRKIADDSRYGEVYQAYRSIRMSIRALPVPPVPPTVSAAIRAYTAATPLRRPVVTLRVRLARFTAAAATMAAAIAAIFTHGFGVPAQFGYGGPAHYGTGNPTAAVVRVSSAPTVATLINARLAYNDVAQVQFDHPVDETAVRQSVRFAPLTDLTQPLAPSQLIYSPNTLTLSTAPTALIPNTDYRVTIPKGLRDLQGNEVQNATFDFSVAPPPLVADAGMVAPTDTVPTLAPIATAPLSTNTSEPATATTVTSPATATTTTTTTTATTTTVEDVPTDTPIAARPTVRPVSVATTAPIAAAAAATAVPVAPTAMVARPVATSTVSATTAPKPTNTAAPVATATATVVPTTAPIAPTATAVVILATSTTAPTAKPGVPVAPSFQGAYAQTANRLGEPTGVSASVSGTQLKFQNGLMVYVPGRPFYIVYAGGSWGTAANPGGGGAAMANPGGGYAPGGAYGAAWTNAKLSGKLGYATSSQESSYSGSLQPFNNGVILQVGGDVYVLFSNGTYQLFST